MTNTPAVKIPMPARTSWKNVPRGAEVPVEIPISHAGLEKAIVRSYPLLDNHLYFISVQLPRMPLAEQASQRPAIEALQSKVVATLEKTEKLIQGFRDVQPECNVQPAGVRILTGVKKTPAASRAIALYSVMDQLLLEQGTQWIEGIISDQTYFDVQSDTVALARNLGVVINGLFREALALSNAINEEKARIRAAA
jgi:hypothetical protein